MKKTLFILLYLMCISFGANAYDFKVDGLCYKINSDGISVSVTYEKVTLWTNLPNGYYDLTGDILIPEVVTNNNINYLVTSIGEGAFNSCNEISSVIIPNSVTSIYGGSFNGCSSLTSLIIPNSVAFIDDGVFTGCCALTSIIVEDGNPKYDSRENCNAIIETETNTLLYGCQNTVIPCSITCIYNYAFYSCSGLTSIIIPNSVTEIGNRAFASCSGLTNLNIPNSVSFIGEYAFSFCENLTKVNIPNSLTTINKSVFSGCNSLTSVIIPNSITSIESQAFYGSGLTSVTLPNSVRVIGDYAFAACFNLSSVNISNSVSLIRNYAFLQDDKLTSISLIGQGEWNYNTTNHKGLSEIISQIKTLNIGVEITSLGNFCFTPDIINSYAINPPSCSNNTFSNYNSELHVPTSSTVAYFTAPYWKNFNNLYNDITEKVTLNETELTMIYGDTLELNAVTNPVGANIIWSSSKPNVATVNDDGVITAKGAGCCDIFATLESNPAVYASCRLYVSYPEITLSLNYDSIEMNVGENTTLIVDISPNNLGVTPIWISSNTSVATVNNGLVTAVGQGECDIIVSVQDKSAVCHVVVNDHIIITLNKSNSIIGANSILTVFPTCTPNLPVELVVTSSDSNVAMVRLIDRINAPIQNIIILNEYGNAFSLANSLFFSSSKFLAQYLASEKAIMIVGVNAGVATITVSTADGMATPATLELIVVDVNGDNVITSSDVTALYDYLLNGNESYIATSDINGDGVITSADITALYNILLGNE